jgi:carbamate kinase
MLPKVQAAMAFVQASKAEAPAALITLLSKARDGIAGKTGTRITR